MPTWPSPALVPIHSCSPHGLIDPILRFSADQGYEIRRSRFSRSRRTYQLVYWHSADAIMILLDFIEREIRGGALSFVWTYPYPTQINSINAATPNLVATTWPHGLQTGDQVVITNTNSHNGTFTVTWVSLNHFSLQGTGGGSAEAAGGLAAQHFPFMTLTLEGDTLEPPELEHSFGAFRNNDALARLSLSFREEFA
jgi:hypothetical protein